MSMLNKVVDPGKIIALSSCVAQSHALSEDFVGTAAIVELVGSTSVMSLIVFQKLSVSAFASVLQSVAVQRSATVKSPLEIVDVRRSRVNL